MDDVLSVARAELLPPLRTLLELVEAEGEPAQHAFFGRVALGIESARDAEDLAGPFMELSTSAFLGFHYSPAATMLIDRILLSAQTLALTLSADTETL